MIVVLTVARTAIAADKPTDDRESKIPFGSSTQASQSVSGSDFVELSRAADSPEVRRGREQNRQSKMVLLF